MKKLTGNEIVRTYIEFFKERGHSEVESASLIPHDDPTVLWVNAGVTPLKKYFDGTITPQNRRMTSCQKCIRTGDIESVGVTARHHTFFQMLGNFSIGDYFKTEALTWAMELLTSPKYFGIDKKKLYVTIYPDDTEAYKLWISLGIDKEHIVKLRNNYWEIGEGPSGPDSEIFYDRGVKYDPDKQGIKLLEKEIENDRYIEIWNNVFSQYNAKEGVPRENYEELPSKNIDTGMGVERMACIMQETETNYETDLFMPIMKRLEDIVGIRYMGQMEYKVIADHIRTLTFAISDGASFENFGRGYVLRRLLRRASRMGRKLNIGHTFMPILVDVVVDNYKEIYPELETNRNLIKELVQKEEELFQKTLLQGEKRLEEIFENSKNNVISGEDAFKLYDTYGYPIELTEECANERGFIVDNEGFKNNMEIQKELARKNRKVDSSMGIQNEILLNYTEESKFVGYDKLSVKTYVIGILKNNKFVNKSTSECFIFLEENPFYAFSGGQVSDKGTLKNNSCKLEVVDVIKCPNKQHMLKVKVLEGVINSGESIVATVDKESREAIMRNHSSIHLIQKTLRDMLGDTVHQAGSRVDDNTFRFDFTYRGRLSDELIVEIEKNANERVNRGIDSITEYMTLPEAKGKGAMALFEDKYDDIVRVVTLGDSIELCGGTHVKNTKDIGCIGILSVTNKGSDTYRIEGTTKDLIKKELKNVVKPYTDEISKLLIKGKNIIKQAKKEKIDIDFDFNINDEELDSYQDVLYYKEQLERLKLSVKKLEKQYNDEVANKSLSNVDEFLKLSEEINGINVIVCTTKDYEVPVLKQLVDTITNEKENSFVLLANVKNSNVNILCKTNINDEKIHCGNIVKDICLKCSGNGGGNNLFAQGGGSDASEISKYLQEVKDSFR
ncbi:MAG: alanine--tRNA ligase [Bacilli bacterium]|nr:alanine--tRNA ligase [Bacilli bacterium]